MTAAEGRPGIPTQEARTGTGRERSSRVSWLGPASSRAWASPGPPHRGQGLEDWKPCAQMGRLRLRASPCPPAAHHIHLITSHPFLPPGSRALPALKGPCLPNPRAWPEALEPLPLPVAGMPCKALKASRLRLLRKGSHQIAEAHVSLWNGKSAPGLD